MNIPPAATLSERRDLIAFSNLTASQKLYLHTVLKNTDRNGFYFPSVNYIVAHSSLSRSSVFRLQKELMTLGILEVHGMYKSSRVKLRRVRFDLLKGLPRQRDAPRGVGASQPHNESHPKDRSNASAVPTCDSNDSTLTQQECQNDTQTDQGQLEKNNNSHDAPHQSPEAMATAVVLLRQAGVGDPKLTALARQHSIPRIEQVIKSAAIKSPRNYAGWIIAALEKGYTLPDTPKMKKLTEKQLQHRRECEEIEGAKYYARLSSEMQQWVRNKVQELAPGNAELLATIGTENEASRIGSAALRLFKKYSIEVPKAYDACPEGEGVY